MLQKLKTKKFWIILTRDISILLIIFYGINLYQTRNTPTQIPVLQWQLISGKEVNLKEMALQSPVLIYFWGSWCPICHFTSSTVIELAKDYQVLTIALSSGDKVDVKNYLQENNYSFPVINDPDGVISHQWGVVATPTLFIINSKGEISSIMTGITNAWGLKIRLWFAS